MSVHKPSPNLLALDTSNQYCSVALQWGDQIHAQHEWSEQKHSQMILPMVRALMSAQNADFAGLDAVVVGIGPGGFTGVRLAVSVAQGLAFAAQKPILAYSSLAAMALAGLRQTAATQIVIAMDARMQQVYWAHYSLSEGLLQAVVAPSLDDVGVFANYLAGIHEPCAVAGNATTVFEPLAQACTRVPLMVAQIDHEAPHAEDLLHLANMAWRNGAWEEGVALSPEQVQPLYVRDKVAQTIAEREAASAVRVQSS